MEMTRKTRRSFKSLSMKWSFALYVTLFVLIALAISTLLSGMFGMLQDNIFRYYDNKHRSELAKQGDLVVDGVVVQNEALWFYTENLHDKFSAHDTRMYNLYGFLSVAVIPIVFVICILATGMLFYLRKLKQPLALLDSASSRIAGGDLDFHLEYDSKNEFGRLVDSFETMRESLYQTNREMWQMMENRKRLNAAFAHDLRTPLTVLRGYCDFLLEYGPKDKITAEKATSTLQMMDTYLKRLDGYTQSMSTMQKLEEIELSLQPINFDKLCCELESMASILTDDKSFAFHSEGEGELLLDPPLVFQVCENLISNASRYAAQKIEILCNFDGRTLTITVSDDGFGFTPEALKKATEPYYREEKSAADSEHFGLGLYTCRLICEKHGGNLKLENDAGVRITARFQSQKISECR